MASNSERTFGSRLNNAKTLYAYINSFTDYAPTREADKPASYQALIDAAGALNISSASTGEQYSLAVEARQNGFKKSPDSLARILSPLNAAVKNIFGKTSKEALDIAAMVVKIRGVEVPKERKDAQGEFVSQSERSYGSMTQTFADIIVMLDTFGNAYKPADPKIRVPALKTQLESLQAQNSAVAVAYAAAITAKDDRMVAYDVLSDGGQSIKDAVKAQYRANSSEYKLVKGLVI